MSKSKPLHGKEIVRAQLAHEMEDRFEGRYDPQIVYIDGEWHYPTSPEKTHCGEDIPDPVYAVANSDFGGPTSMACSECLPPIGKMTKRGVRDQISKHFPDVEMQNSQGFSKDGLVALLEFIEDNRGEGDG